MNTNMVDINKLLVKFVCALAICCLYSKNSFAEEKFQINDFVKVFKEIQRASFPQVLNSYFQENIVERQCKDYSKKACGTFCRFDFDAGWAAKMECDDSALYQLFSYRKYKALKGYSVQRLDSVYRIYLLFSLNTKGNAVVSFDIENLNKMQIINEVIYDRNYWPELDYFEVNEQLYDDEVDLCLRAADLENSQLALKIDQQNRCFFL